MERVELSIGPASGAAPTQKVTEFSGGTLKLGLTGPEVSFTMPGQSPAALLTDGLVTDVWVYRRGVLWQRLRVLPVDQSWTEDGGTDATVTAVGYRRLVEARNIISAPPTFTAVDQGTIVWNLIQHTQAQTGGDLGITSGTVVTGVPRDRTEYLIGDNLGKLLTDLSNVETGLWWGIDSAKVLTALLWSAFPTALAPLVRGVNARTLRRSRGSGFANVAGSVGSKEQTVVAWATDAGVGTDPRGRWEAFDSSHSSATLQATVQDYADGLLAERLHPPSVWTAALDPASYFEGDSGYNEGEFVTIVVPSSAVDEIGVPPVNVNAQITELSIAFDDSGSTSVGLTAVEVA